MSRSKKIMVADDDPAILDAMEMLLVDEGYDVLTASDGSMINKLLETHPDLILLDIWMSGEDGREIAKHLKNQKDTMNIPIILISASKDIDKSARESGADDFLAKPFEIDDLLSIVKQYISNGHSPQNTLQ